jgi:predicted permease
LIDGQPVPATQDQLPWVVKYVVGPEYLATMRMPLVRGRFFTPRDDDHAPRVVVIDDVFARMYFPGIDPVGKRLRTGDYDMAPAEIVGVVGHVKQWGLDQDETTTVRAQLYEPFLQLQDEELPMVVDGVTALARTRGDAAESIGALRTTVQQLGGDNVMFRARSIDEIIASYQTTRRFAMYVLAAFAALALLLSCVGIYGVVSYVVDQRTTEIGIRMALGARGRDILGLILRQGAKLVLAGVVLGLAGAYAAAPFMAKLIYGVASDDPWTLAGVACAVAIIALAAMLLPARRAMRMEPMQALRTD